MTPSGVYTSDKRDKPRGIRNHNPGNIRRTYERWEGMAFDQSKDAEFVVFNAPIYGLRALMIVLRNYQKRHNLRTIDAIINRWAPPVENDTTGYVWHVSKVMRVDPDTELTLTDKDTLINMTKAIVRHENGTPPDDGKDWYDNNFYDQAARMVLGDK